MWISARAMAFWGIVLGSATAAHACMGCTPDRYSAIPGLAFIRPDLILLYPILAGTLERPIYSLAGFRTSTWGFSIQANLLAWIASSVFGFVAFGTLFFRGELIVFIGAPLIGMLVKMIWFRRVPRDASSRSPIGYFFLATLLSTLVIASLPMWMELLGTSSSSWAYKTRGLKAAAILICVMMSIGVHCAVFGRLKREPPKADVRRGFEVITSEAVPLAIEVPKADGAQSIGKNALTT